MLLRLLTGLLRSVGGLLGGVVLGDFGLELLLGGLDLVVEVLDQNLLAYDGGLGGGGGVFGGLS